MALIRQCQPKTFEEWGKNGIMKMQKTDAKTPVKIKRENLDELGERLFVKISEIVIPEWTEAFQSLTLQDCIEVYYQSYNK